jgi:uncharacterized protein with NRDE domain
MCLIVTAHGVAERYALVLAANRDERHARPSADAHWWPDAPDVLGGRDLVAGGSWLAVNRRGHIAAVTNVADPSVQAAPLSRGLIVSEYLQAADPAGVIAEMAAGSARYAPFNALLIEPGRLSYVSNRAAAGELGPGIHSLSNAPLGTRWPKLARAESRLAELLHDAEPTEALFRLLAQTDASADEGAHLPADDRADEPVDYRGSLFIKGGAYGTRASTIVLVGHDGAVRFSERRFDPEGRVTGTSQFEFRLPKDDVAPARRCSALTS